MFIFVSRLSEYNTHIYIYIYILIVIGRYHRSACGGKGSVCPAGSYGMFWLKVICTVLLSEYQCFLLMDYICIYDVVKGFAPMTW